MSGQEDREGEGDNYMSESEVSGKEESDESEERGSPRFSAAKARRAILGLSELSDNEDYPLSQLKTSLATKLKRATAKAKERSQEKTLLSQAGHPGVTTPPAAKRAKVIQGVEGKNKRLMTEKHHEHSSSSGHPVTPLARNYENQ